MSCKFLANTLAPRLAGRGVYRAIVASKQNAGVGRLFELADNLRNGLCRVRAAARLRSQEVSSSQVSSNHLPPKVGGSNSIHLAADKGRRRQTSQDRAAALQQIYLSRTKAG